jgi:hypothetical protein
MVVAVIGGTCRLDGAGASIVLCVRSATCVLRCGFAGLDEIAVLADDVGDERSMQ